MRDKLPFIALIICLTILSGCTSTTASPESELSTFTSTEAMPSVMPTTTATSTAAPLLPTLTVDTIPTVPTPTASALPTMNPASQPVQSPDGPPVVFLYKDGFLTRTDIDGSGFELMARPLGGIGDVVWMYFWANPPQVSPDGRWLIVFNSVSSSRGNWQVIDLQTSNEVATGQGQSRLSPTWSPNSQQFAYLAERQVCIFDLMSLSDNCTVIGSDLIGAVWSPAREQIAVAQANFDFTGQVWLFQAASKTAEIIGTFEVPPQATVNDALEWAADGSSLLIKGTTENVPSILYSVIDETAVTFTEPLQTISPNGQYILYKSGVVEKVDGTIQYLLPTNEVCSRVIFKLHNWDWSPDNERLAYLLSCTDSDAQERSWLIVINVTTGELLWQQEIVALDNTFPLEFLYWSPDGKYLLLDEPDELYEGQRQLSPIWRIMADGSTSLEVIAEHGFLLGTVRQWMP